jgi:hypothetical protein
MALLDVGAFRAEVVEDLSANGPGPTQIVNLVGEGSTGPTSWPSSSTP